jgi:hypothetical protein
MSVKRLSLFLASWLLGSCLGNHQVWGTSLFRCLTEGEQIVYTDTPSQLDQCAPITTSGAVTSLATTSSGPPVAGHPFDQSPPPQPVSHPPQPAQSPEGTATTFVGSPASAATEPLPCPVGINPLNPFTNPPCPH